MCEACGWVFAPEVRRCYARVPHRSNGGNTVAIVGSIANGVFSVTSGMALTLTNLTLPGGIDRDGGCLYANGALVLDNVQVRNCSTGSIGGRGGAIFVSATGSAML